MNGSGDLRKATASLGQDSRGVVNILLIPLLLSIVFLLGALGFGFWAFGSRADYKNNSDRKVEVAVADAIVKTQAEDAKKYAEAAKEPYETYVGPAEYGNITVNYPKTWSAYAITGVSSKPVDAYFNPGHVPTVTNPKNSFALRTEINQQSYDTTLLGFKGAIQTGKLTASAYSLPKVPDVVGTRLEGQITPAKQGVMIILPLRNMTLKIWTESMDFKGDLDTHVLANMTFIP